MSSSTSSSSSGEKKPKSRQGKTFLGIKWPGRSSSSGSSSSAEGKHHLVVPESSVVTPQSASGFMTGGIADWSNPDWDLPQDTIPEQVVILPFPCQVTCSMTIISRKAIRDLPSLLRKLELWVDQYNGSYVCKPYHTLIYILLGAKLVSRKATSRNYEYHSKFQGVIRFGVQSDRNKPPSERFRLVMNEGLEESYYAISFECDLSESKRKGIIYSELYKLNGYHYTFPDMMELLGLKVTINSEGLIASA